MGKIVAAYHEDLSGALPEAPRRPLAAPSAIASSSSFLAEQKALAVSRAQRFAAELGQPKLGEVYAAAAVPDITGFPATAVLSTMLR